MLPAPAPVTGAAGGVIIHWAKHHRRGLAPQVFPCGFGVLVSLQCCWVQGWLYGAAGDGDQGDGGCPQP